MSNQTASHYYHAYVRVPGAYVRHKKTPQTVKLDRLCQAYDVAHQRVQNWGDLVEAISFLPTSGVRVIEVPTDRKADKLKLQELLSSV